MIKQLLLEILDYYRYKITNDKCTQDDMKSVYKVLSENVTSQATIKDIAEFYNQSESNVRNVICRNFIEPPQRRVHYDFHSFIKFIPKSWRKNASEEEKRDVTIHKADEKFATYPQK